MTERRKFNVLLWKENTFIRPHRFKKRMLTLEEANERLHRHFPNMDILIYRGTRKTALVHCKDCENTFETSYGVQGYVNGSKIECEKCKKINYVNKCLDLVKDTKFELRDVIIRKDYRGYDRKVLLLWCNDCGREVEFNPDEDISKYNCPVCKYRNILNKYNELLKNLNMYVTDYRYDEDGVMWFNCVCSNCGDIKERRQDKLGKLKSCPNCNEIAIISKAKNCYTNSGFKYIQQIIYKPKFSGNEGIYRKEECVHLFCGKPTIKVSYTLRNTTMCRNCSNRIIKGKPKEHNKHLVEENLQMLKNVQAFKNAWVRQVPDALEKLDEGFVKVVLTHIDGWIKNYEGIAKTYPNGDLGTVIENNPLYKQVEEVFYPVMKQYGFKIEGE